MRQGSLTIAICHNSILKVFAWKPNTYFCM